MADVLQRLVNAVRNAAIHDPGVQAAPRCILWTDGDGQWERVAARLQAELPEMFILGDYDPSKRTGPAIWLRCVIANKAPNIRIPEGVIPILYLPGVSRQDLRAVESCPDHLKPLAELQYSGMIRSQINAKDWTILAFLKSDQGGLGLDVAMDNETKRSIRLALHRLLDEDVDLLKGKRLDKDFFHGLLSKDHVRDFLLWLDRGEAFKAGRDEMEWIAFVDLCKSQLNFDPENDGALKGAELLANREGPWLSVWERFCEAPTRYPEIPGTILKCHEPRTGLLWLINDGGKYDGWPQWNRSQEKSLRGELQNLDGLPPHKAREKLPELEKSHCRRRSLVWAELGDAPLAQAMEHLAVLVDATTRPLTAGTLAEIVEMYRSSAWKADDAVIRSLACVVGRQEDFEAVKTSIRATYSEWAEESARYVQRIISRDGYPVSGETMRPPEIGKPGECSLFVDGLRFDAAKRLAEKLISRGLNVVETPAWAALPSVTATGKPAVTPVAHLLVGSEVNADFEPCTAEGGRSLKGGYRLDKLLEAAGWSVSNREQDGGSEGPAWREVGNIDHEGHERGWKLAGYLETILNEIADRIGQSLEDGFTSIRVVTDHGWLLLPGGLPKTELPACLTENKWGRCAVLKAGASTDERLFPWFWNVHRQFALADGISCYRAGMEYAHGGLSLQECLTLQLLVSKGGKTGPQRTVEISDVVWTGLRCKVAVEGDATGLSLDLRMQPGRSASSIALGVKPFKEDGSSSVVVDDDDLEGQKATVTVIDDDGRPVAQRITVIGKRGE